MLGLGLLGAPQWPALPVEGLKLHTGPRWGPVQREAPTRPWRLRLCPSHLGSGPLGKGGEVVTLGRPCITPGVDRIKADGAGGGQPEIARFGLRADLSLNESAPREQVCGDRRGCHPGVNF